jgi:cell division protein FtsL
MRKISKVLLTILTVIVLVACVVLYVQYDNISALINGMNTSSDDLAAEMNDNREKLKEEVEKYTSSPINDISAEDEEKLLNGDISIEDVAEKYHLPLDYMNDDNEDTMENSSGTTSTSGNTIPETSDNKDNEKAIDAAISGGVSKMYALKAKYVNKLGELEREVIKEYSNLPKEKQNENSKYSIVMDNIDYIAELEKKCDNDVANVLSTLESELIRLNGDTEIIQILKDAYQKEKEVKKAYYLSLYNK